jgi:hypothetical protein
MTPQPCSPMPCWPPHQDERACRRRCQGGPVIYCAPVRRPPPGGRTSLLKALEQVTDPRARRGIRHNIASTLAMVVAAGLSGAGRSFRSVGDFAADLPQDALARVGARFHPVQRRYIAPNEATIRRHVQMIDADQADAAVGGWLAARFSRPGPRPGRRAR